MSRDGSIYSNGKALVIDGGFRPPDNPIVFGLLSELFANNSEVLIDMSKCTGAFPNTMLPLIARIAQFRNEGGTLHAVLPNRSDVRSLFLQNNWAHFLSPRQYKKSDDVSDKLLSVKQYTTHEEMSVIIEGITDVVIGMPGVDRSSLTVLEYALSEIMDNVVNHSQSKIGGFVQLSTFPNDKKIAFCVADSGLGILQTLKEGYPDLNSDKVAIEMAVRAGVTRNSEGQGNGLSIALNIATNPKGQGPRI